VVADPGDAGSCCSKTCLTVHQDTHPSRPDAGFAGREVKSAMRATTQKEGARWGTMGSPTVLNAPRPALVETTGGGEPRVVNRELVTVVRDSDASTLWWIAYLGIFPTAIAFSTWAYVLARSDAENHRVHSADAVEESVVA